MAVGLEGAKASEIVERFDRERIERQINALPSRKIKSSRTGFLIRAIELDIPVESAQAPVTEASRLAEHFYAELGGNSGEPVGFVSTADEEAAQSLVTKLPKVLSVKPDRAGPKRGRNRALGLGCHFPQPVEALLKLNAHLGPASFAVVGSSALGESDHDQAANHKEEDERSSS